MVFCFLPVPSLLKKLCCVAEKPQNPILSKIYTWETDRKSICIVKKLGAGWFAEVWMGIWNGTTEIAVIFVFSPY